MSISTNIDLRNLDFHNKKVLVVGDIMLDKYWHGSTERISPEAPVPIVKIDATDYRLGGAANVALNLQSLGCDVMLLGVVGDDEAAHIVDNLLSAHNMSCKMFKLKDYKTIVKLRIMSRHQQLIRLDKENELKVEQLSDLHSFFKSEVSSYDAVVLSDYAKGCLLLAQEMIKEARAVQVPVIVDPKGRDYSKYTGATVIKPNFLEFTTIVGPCPNQEILEQKAQKLLNQLQLEYLVVTQGDHGMTVATATETLHLPAVGAEVYDVTGAGDTVAATIAASIAAGMSIFQAANLSTITSSIVVSKVGTSKVSMAELKAVLNERRTIPLGFMCPSTVKELIKICQARGEKIVFVNGCYDLVHYGHVRYLQAARSKGDRLVIGINSDSSVKKLKGDSRPMYPAAQRAEVLSALECVDWVVEFSEPTPGELVKQLNPDVIVKGNENFKTIDDIPANEGVEHVLARGGEVHLVPRTDGCSSTAMIDILQEATEIE